MRREDQKGSLCATEMSEVKGHSALQQNQIAQNRTQAQAGRSEPQWSHLQVIGQVDLTYIVTQSRDAVIFIDQHAAHERVLFEKLQRLLKKEPFDTQSFLIPLRIEMDEDGVEAVLEQSESLERLGLTVESMGPTTLVVNSAPSILKPEAIEKALKLFAEESIDKGGSYAVEKTLDHVVATMACHSAIRANQVLNQMEMEALLKSMDAFSLPGFCPHGRPVYLEYKFNRLHREIGRLG